MGDVDDLVDFFWRGRSGESLDLSLDVSDTMSMLLAFMRARREASGGDGARTGAVVNEAATPSTCPSTPTEEGRIAYEQRGDISPYLGGASVRRLQGLRVARVWAS